MQSNHLYAPYFIIYLEIWCINDDICLIMQMGGKEGPIAAKVLLQVIDVLWDSGSSWQLQQSKHCAAWRSQSQKHGCERSSMRQWRKPSVSEEKRKAVTCSHSLQWKWGAVNHDWGDNRPEATIFEGPPYTQGRRPPRNLDLIHCQVAAAAAELFVWCTLRLPFLLLLPKGISCGMVDQSFTIARVPLPNQSTCVSQICKRLTTSLPSRGWLRVSLYCKSFSLSLAGFGIIDHWPLWWTVRSEVRSNWPEDHHL